MSAQNVTVQISTHLADMVSPILAALRVRNQFSEYLLFETSDQHSDSNSTSILAVDPLDVLEVRGGTTRTGDQVHSLAETLNAFVARFQLSQPSPHNGIFGFTGFETIQYMDTFDLQPKPELAEIPELRYALYRFVLVFNHENDQLTLIHNMLEGAEPGMSAEDFLRIVFAGNAPTFPFRLDGDEHAETSEADYLDSVKRLKQHIHRGDIFQIVPSRRFSHGFSGDDFNLYRALRTINPSPYLFYLDFGTFRLLGSSPEAQVLVHGGTASVHPIAGTFRRTGDDASDAQAAVRLGQDPKETSEHRMLVDLARNDLSKSCFPVRVERLQEVQFYSHVIHLVSKVVGVLREGVTPVDVFCDTFPMGTVSGAPKHRALTLIHEHEPVARQFFAGSVGFFGFENNTVHAISIRTFLSLGDRLHYQAGGGVVDESDPESERDEIDNKLRALRAALRVATEVQ